MSEYSQTTEEQLAELRRKLARAESDRDMLVKRLMGISATPTSASPRTGFASSEFWQPILVIAIFAAVAVYVMHTQSLTMEQAVLAVGAMVAGVIPVLKSLGMYPAARTDLKIESLRSTKP